MKSDLWLYGVHWYYFPQLLTSWELQYAKANRALKANESHTTVCIFYVSL